MATPSFITRVKLNNKEYELRGLFYATCGTAAATQTKEISVEGITSLYDGLNVRIKFTYGQTYNGQPKLKVNSLDAKGIVYQGSTAAVRYQWYAGEVLDLVYDGTNFVILNEGRATTSYWGMTKLSSAVSTDNTTAATPGAVKTAYDLASSAYTLADAAGSIAHAVESKVTSAMIYGGTLGSAEDFATVTNLPEPSAGVVNHYYICIKTSTYNQGYNNFWTLNNGDTVICSPLEIEGSTYYEWRKIPSSTQYNAPISHASTSTTYGQGTSANYGHVKLSDAVNSTSGAAAGIAATPSAVKSAYDLASAATSTAAAAYTLASNISQDILAMQATQQIYFTACDDLAPNFTVSVPEIEELTDGLALRVWFANAADQDANFLTINNSIEQIQILGPLWDNYNIVDLVYSSTDEVFYVVGSSRIPNHASTLSVFGRGNTTQYGHVKISDSVSSTTSAASGVAASPSAVKSAYDLASSAYSLASAATSAIAELPDPMVFKGTVGKSGGSGTVAALPTSGVKIGDTYKIIEENKTIAATNSTTGSSVTAKIGDTIIATATTPKWTVIPSGDEPSGTVTSVKIQATSPIAIDNSAAITSTGTRTISHADSGVSAGTYPKVTVNATGHVTSGTTLAATDIPAHTSTATTYGAGTSSAYGHLKLSNSYNSAAVIASGYAATPAAAYSAALVVSQASITSASSGANRILLGSTDDTAQIQSVYKDADLVFTPSTSTLQTVNESLTGSLTVTGNAYLNNNAYVHNLSADALIVTGNTNFVNIPTAPTASAGTNTTQLATTEFVQTAVAGASFTPSTGTAVSSITFSAGTLPTLGTAIAVDDITSWSAGSLPTLGTAIAVDDITSWSAGSLPTLGTAIAVDDITSWSAGSLPTLGTAIAADDITSWSAGTATTATVTSGVLVISAGTTPTLSYSAKSIPNVTGVGALPSLSYSAKSVPNVTGVGTLPSLSYSAKSVPNVTGVGSLPSLSYSAKSVPNVTAVGSLPSLSYSTTTVVTSI